MDIIATEMLRNAGLKQKEQQRESKDHNRNVCQSLSTSSQGIKQALH